MDTPFFQKIQRVAGKAPRFFVPGHKGNADALPFLADMLRYDITEVNGADDLQNPTDTLLQSQQNMSRLYASGASLYSAFGSSSCILAMLALFVGDGGQLVIARGCHVAAVRGLALLDITPHWVAQSGGVPPAQDVQSALIKSGAKAVYITSVDYYGRMADVSGIAAVCQRLGAVLLVDNAHGAHLRFVSAKGQKKGDAHPLAAGADACCDSAHKSLPCLTGAALLHLKDATLRADARQALNLFCSTSPSYPILLSLDFAAGLLSGESPPDFEKTAHKIKTLRQNFSKICENCDDPLRLILRPSAAGFSAQEFHLRLLSEEILPEFYDGERIVLMATPFNTEQDFERLSCVLGGILRTLPREEGAAAPHSPPLMDAYTAKIQEQACGVRSALFGKKEQVSTQDAPGRIMASLAVPCPPGVPAVMPGEVLCEGTAQLYAQSGILSLSVLK